MNKARLVRFGVDCSGISFDVDGQLSFVILHCAHKSENTPTNTRLTTTRNNSSNTFFTMKFSSAALAMALSLPALAIAQPLHPLRIEADFIEECSGVDLPYNGMMLSLGVEQDVILSCMLDHVMTTSATEFGIDQDEPACFPLGYEDISTVCQDSLSVAAYDECNNEQEGDMMDEFYFMSMSMSMSMANGGDSPQLDDDDMPLRSQFCTILEGLTTEQGLSCLESVCESSMPSSAPSEELSGMPSTMPSEEPSASPTSAPSNSPSSTPSSAPSSTPTLVVTQPEVVQTSASTLASVTMSLAFLAATAVFVF